MDDKPESNGRSCAIPGNSATRPSQADIRDSCRVSICVATCQRAAGLKKNLSSLAALTFRRIPRPNIEVIVVDNDDRREGLDTVKQLSDSYPWKILALHEPVRGISHARNTLVRAARNADFIAFIDDDEYAEPQWLEELLVKAFVDRAEVVLGPVRYELEASSPAWLHKLFEAPPLHDGKEVGAGNFRTGNLLISNRCLADIEGPFDPEFALTGGSDTFLGHLLEQRNVRFIWSANAIVHETVPEQRRSLKRYFTRRYRDGMVYAMVQRRILGTPAGALRALYRGSGSVAMALYNCLLSVFPGRESPFQAFGLVAYGIGNIAGMLGHRYREYEAGTGD